MRQKILFEAILLIMIFASIWLVLSIFPLLPEKKHDAISTGQEQKIGDLLLNSILSTQDYLKIESDTLEDALNAILDRLVDAVEDNDYTFNIYILNDGMANAFALPGGYILITSGLFKLLDSPEEMASVIAHEMGHISKRHTTSRLLKNFTITLLFADKNLVSEASKIIISSAFDRKQEEEADLFALELLEKAKINPRVLGTAFRHLRDRPGAYNPIFEIIMSHPDMDSRIKAAYDYQLEKDFVEEPFQMDWETVRLKVEEATNTEGS